MINAAKPDNGIFVPREELNGLSGGFVAIPVGWAVCGVFFGIIAAADNPWGDTMERVGCLARKAIVRGLEGLNDLIERINIAWTELFAVAAPQPVQV